MAAIAINRTLQQTRCKYPVDVASGISCRDQAFLSGTYNENPPDCQWSSYCRHSGIALMAPARPLSNVNLARSTRPTPRPTEA